MNSRALALLGIDAKTPDPSGGVILREKGGAPSGILIDNAAYGAMKRLPLRTPEQYQAAIKWAVAKMNALGVTAMKDALADGHAVTAYAALDRAGQLDMRVATSRPWHATWTESDADEARNLEHWRDDETRARAHRIREDLRRRDSADAHGGDARALPCPTRSTPPASRASSSTRPRTSTPRSCGSTRSASR